MIYRELYAAQGIDSAGNTLTTFPRRDPHAFHFRRYFAVAIGADTSTRSVAQLFGTIHGARHAGRTQHALTAHLTAEHETFDLSFDGGERSLDSMLTESA